MNNFNYLLVDVICTYKVQSHNSMEGDFEVGGQGATDNSPKKENFRLPGYQLSHENIFWRHCKFNCKGTNYLKIYFLLHIIFTCHLILIC